MDGNSVSSNLSISFSHIADIPSGTHPDYQAQYGNWWKYRLVYEGNDAFIQAYLKRYSLRETAEDFQARKDISYNPAHAASCVDEIKNAIFQRIGEVNRNGLTDSYAAACQGQRGGIDLADSRIEEYIGFKILPELLPMGKVGVFVDSPSDVGATMATSAGKHPYFSLFQVEDILSWAHNQQNQLTKLLLRYRQYTYDPVTGCPDGLESYNMLYTLTEKGIVAQKMSTALEISEPPNLIALPMIPFVLFDLGDSLLAKVANHQVALLNMASSAVSYSCKSNFPMYTEQFEPRAEQAAAKVKKVDDDGKIIESEDKEVETGVSTGRMYARGLERPGFISPSTEPLKGSLDHQKEIKEEIRTLVNLSVAKLAQTKTTAESKSYDERDLEAGLSYIGLILQKGERQLAKIWAAYEKQKIEPNIGYPNEYSLKSDDERRKNAAEISKIMGSIPSQTFRRECANLVAKTLLERQIPFDKLNAIYAEIEAAKVIVTEVKELTSDFENGLVTGETASMARGYPSGEYKKAQEEKVERAAAIVKAQAPKASGLQNPAARGVQDLSAGGPKDAKDEKAMMKDGDMKNMQKEMQE